MKIKKYLVIKDFYMKHGNMEILYKKGELVNSTNLTDPAHMIYVQPLSSAKWAIKRTPENADVVNKWANENIQNGYNDNVDYILSDYGVSDAALDGYTEIDFETFKEITGMGEEKGFKVGDWVIGWHNVTSKQGYHKKCWEIGIIEDGFANPKNTENDTSVENIRHAKPEEIAAATQQKIFTIEDVRNGKCAIENDGTREDLVSVLKYTFPEDTTLTSIPDVDLDYPLYHKFNNCQWAAFRKTDLPTQSVKLFLSQIEGEKEQPTEEWQPKWGEEVEASDDGRDWIVGYVYCCPHPLYKGEHLITRVMPNNTARYKMVRKPLEIHEFTTEQAKQDIAKLHNLNVNQIKIVE